jgi:hypothetical protein
MEDLSVAAMALGFALMAGTSLMQLRLAARLGFYLAGAAIVAASIMRALPLPVSAGVSNAIDLAALCLLAIVTFAALFLRIGPRRLAPFDDKQPEQRKVQ